MRQKLPEYAYSKSECWTESGPHVSHRLRSRSSPIASRHSHLNVETHPELTGHVMFDVVFVQFWTLCSRTDNKVFCCSYVDSILENGAIVASNIEIISGRDSSDPTSKTRIRYCFRIRSHLQYSSPYSQVLVAHRRVVLFNILPSCHHVLSSVVGAGLRFGSCIGRGGRIGS